LILLGKDINTVLIQQVAGTLSEAEVSSKHRIRFAKTSGHLKALFEVSDSIRGMPSTPGKLKV